MTFATRYGSIAFIALAACSGDDDDSTITRYSNVGRLCIESVADAGDDQPLHVGVVFPTCLSSSCDAALDESCTVTREGTSLRVVSSARVRSLGPGHACTDDCGFLIAQCKSPPVPAGTYTVRYGDKSKRVTLPAAPTNLFPSDQNPGGEACLHFVDVPGQGSWRDQDGG